MPSLLCMSCRWTSSTLLHDDILNNTIVPTPRGVSSHAPLVSCPEGIIPRVGRTGIPITLITWSTFLLCSTLGDRLPFSNIHWWNSSFPMSTFMWPPYTFFLGLISVGYHLKLHVAITFYRHLSFSYHLRYIIFFGVHVEYLYYLGKKQYSW